MNGLLRFEVGGTSVLEGNTLSGTVHLFGKRALVGNVYHEFALAAFDKALKDPLTDVRAFWNHDTRLILGRQSNGTVRLTRDLTTLHHEIDLPDTSYAADIKTLAARQDLGGMSFGVVPGVFTEGKASDGRRVFSHQSVARLIEISPVSLPAFDGSNVMLNSEDLADHTLSLDTQIVLTKINALVPHKHEGV